MKTIIVNLIGGPGTGKSTLMAQLYADLKILGIEAEMAPEYVKEKVWDESFKVMDDQIYVFGKQLHRINRLIGKVQVVICDSPLLNSIVYDQSQNKKFAELVIDQFGRFPNLNFFIERSTSYIVKGRLQTEEEAREIDDKFIEVMSLYHIPFDIVNKDQAKYVIINRILDECKEVREV